MRFSRLLILVFLLHSGCGWLPVIETEPQVLEAIPESLPNPISIKVESREFAWNTLIDTVDDYFDIAEEHRVNRIGGVYTDGHIVTHWKPGSGVQELWNKDSTPGFEKWHATFQSIRRRADIHVSPSPVGYDIQVTVYKQLEDLDRPEQSSVGRSLQRHDGAIVRQGPNPKAQPAHLGWIPLGRDVSLEQAILADIQGRFTSVITPEDIQLLPSTIPPIDLRRSR